MTRHLDPDRSPPPRFWPFPIDIDTSVCSRCSSMVPATDKAQETHRDHHAKVDALEAAVATVALTRQLSDPGSRTTPSAAGNPTDASPGSASTPAAGRRAPALARGDLGKAAGSNVPTPEQEATAGRSGVEDTQQGTDAAGVPLLPGSVTEAPEGPTSPGRTSGATKRVGRGSGDPGEHQGSAPADTTGRLHLVDGYGRTEAIDYNPPDHGRFSR